jgi:hypothetical protein
MSDDIKLDALYQAWTIIANASGGDWSQQSDEWQEAAKRWRDEVFHPLLGGSVSPPSPEPERCPTCGSDDPAGIALECASIHPGPDNWHFPTPPAVRPEPYSHWPEVLDSQFADSGTVRPER